MTGSMACPQKGGKLLFAEPWIGSCGTFASVRSEPAAPRIGRSSLPQFRIVWRRRIPQRFGDRIGSQNLVDPTGAIASAQQATCLRTRIAAIIDITLDDKAADQRVDIRRRQSVGSANVPSLA